MPHRSSNRYNKIAGAWTPDYSLHPDAALVGTLGVAVSRRIQSVTTLRQVYAISHTWEHIETEHARQYDHSLARELLPALLQEPTYVYAGRKKNTIVFAKEYDATHYLTVPLKVIREPQPEFWLQSMYIRNDSMVWAELRRSEVYFMAKKVGTPGRSG